MLPSRSRNPSLLYAIARRFESSNIVLAISVVAAALLPTQGSAGPRVVHEVAKILNPDPLFPSFATDVAVEGDDIIVTAFRSAPELEYDEYERTAHLFRRDSQGNWQYVKRLVTNPEYWGYPLTVSMDDGMAAIGAMASLDVLDRIGGEWIHSASPGGGGLMAEVEIDAGTIVHDIGNSGAAVLKKNAAGEWVRVANLPGPRGIPEGEFVGSVDVDVSGDTVMMSGYDAPEFEEPGEEPARGPETYFYSNRSGNYVLEALFPYVGRPAISGDYAISNDTFLPGIRVFDRTTGAWQLQGSFAPADLFVRNVNHLEMDGELAVAALGWWYPELQNRRAVGVFQRDANGTFTHVADLVPSDSLTSEGFGYEVDIDGRRVVVSGDDAAYVFDLPLDLSQPNKIQDDFEDGNAADWTAVAGSTFGVVTSGGTRVLRQSSVAGDAGATLSADWTDQVIHADVRANAFNGSNRWFGLVVRKTNESNYYYVALRSSNVIELKRMVNGAFQTLASATLPVTLNRNYRVTLEAVGTLLRAYVNGRVMVQAHDASLSHGRAGVQMYKTRADYDNVVVSPSPFTSLFDTQNQFAPLSQWTTGENSTWTTVDDGGTLVYEQSAVDTTTPWATVGIETDDQIVSARAKAVSFGASPNAWFGVIARYRDDGNYYYVTVRKNNTISLRKLVNGTIHVFDTATMTVNPGAWYQLRLETVGNRLRTYVNGNLVLEAVDNQPIESGQYGLVTYKTIARFDELGVSQP